MEIFKLKKEIENRVQKTEYIYHRTVIRKLSTEKREQKTYNRLKNTLDRTKYKNSVSKSNDRE